MKYLKLLAIFVAVVAGLYLALNWNGIFSNGEDDVFSDEDLVDIKEMCKNIEDEWRNVMIWDSNLYVDRFAEIEQLKGMKMISERGYNTLRTRLFECSVNKLNESFINALSPNNYKHNTVCSLNQGVEVISRYEGIPTENLSNYYRLNHIHELYGLYTNVYDYVNSKHIISANFDKKNKTWTSFDARQQSVINKAETYKNNPLYSEMRNVPGFADGLDSEKIREMTERYRDKFYADLSKQIISYYGYTVPSNNINATDPNQAELTLTNENKTATVYLQKLDDETQRIIASLFDRYKNEYNNDNSTCYQEFDDFNYFYEKFLIAKNEYVDSRKNEINRIINLANENNIWLDKRYLDIYNNEQAFINTVNEYKTAIQMKDFIDDKDIVNKLEDSYSKMQVLYKNYNTYSDTNNALDVKYDETRIKALMANCDTIAKNESNPDRKDEIEVLHNKLDKYGDMVAEMQIIIKDIDSRINEYKDKNYKAEKAWDKLNKYIEKQYNDKFDKIDEIPWLKSQRKIYMSNLEKDCYSRTNQARKEIMSVRIRKK